MARRQAYRRAQPGSRGTSREREVAAGRPRALRRGNGGARRSVGTHGAPRRAGIPAPRPVGPGRTLQGVTARRCISAPGTPRSRKVQPGVAPAAVHRLESLPGTPLAPRPRPPPGGGSYANATAPPMPVRRREERGRGSGAGRRATEGSRPTGGAQRAPAPPRRAPEGRRSAPAPQRRAAEGRRSAPAPRRRAAEGRRSASAPQRREGRSWTEYESVKLGDPA
jgi:hypothetical protein